MKKGLFSLSLLFAISQTAEAQVLKGCVKDKNEVAIELADVVCLARSDSSFISGAITDSSGQFAVDAKGTDVLLRISSVGYKTLYLSPQKDDIGIVHLEGTVGELGEVVVRSSLPKTILKNGGMTTTVAGSILEKAGTMENLLDRIPNVSAQDGSIKVFGRGEPVIYINGRQMLDRSELDRLHSDNIKSVEVISNPGARYSATTKAVIRITTKKTQGDGFGFDATAVGTYDEENNFGGSGRLNLNYRKNGLELGANAFGAGQRSPDNKGVKQLTYLDKTWNQQDETRLTCKTTTMNYRLSASYLLNDNNSLGVSISFLRTPKQTWDGTTSGLVLQDEALSENSTSASLESWKKSNLSSNVYYVGRLGRLGIDFNTDWLWSKERQRSRTDEDYQEVGQKMQSQLVSSATSKYNRLIASKLVLTYPLWLGELSFGAEYSFTNRNSDYTITPNSLAAADNNRIKEGMSSAFITYSHDIGKLNVEAGLRYENVDFKYYDDGLYVAEQSKAYGNWFPSLSLSMPIGNVQMQLNYAADINRPSYWALRSGVTYDDRYTYETGNPFLVSEIARNLSYDVAFKWMTFDFTYSHTSHPIYQTVEVYNDNAAIGLMKMINGESYNSVSASLNLQPAFGIWHPSLSAMVEKQWFKMETREGRCLDTPLAMIKLDNTFDTKFAMFSILMTCITKGYEENLYFRKPMFNTDLSVTKSLMNDRLTVQLYANDLFGTNDSHTIAKYGKLKEMVFDEFSTTKISLTLRYKFNTTRSKYKGTGAGQDQKRRM